MVKLNKAQQLALKRKWQQDNQGITYLAFRRTVTLGGLSGGYVMVAWCNMCLGIETDGYTHS